MKEVKRADFATRKFSKYGHIYALQPNGVWTKDGKPDNDLYVGSHINGQNIYCLWDGAAFVGKLQDDFGFLTNSWPFERVHEGQRTMPDGTIEKYTWDVYRTPDKGMYCEETCRRWEADGVHLIESIPTYRKPVAMV